MSLKRMTSTVLAASLIVGLAGAASAQRQGGGGGGGGFGGMRGGFGGPGGAASPRRSDPMGLLNRQEVKTHLQITIKQQAALDELTGQTRNMMGQRMGALMDWQSLRDMTPEQRQQKMQEIRPQIEAAVTAFQGEMSDKVKAILTPEQAARLRQLDLQRRGPLSMADPKVAEELKITPPHRAEIEKIAAAYEQENGQIMRTAFEQARTSGTRPDFESRLSPLRQKVEKTRKDAEASVLKVLSPEEMAAWTAAIGEPFTFRPDPPRTQRPGGFGGGQRPGGRQRGGAGGQGQPNFN